MLVVRIGVHARVRPGYGSKGGETECQKSRLL